MRKFEKIKTFAKEHWVDIAFVGITAVACGVVAGTYVHVTNVSKKETTKALEEIVNKYTYVGETGVGRTITLGDMGKFGEEYMKVTEYDANTIVEHVDLFLNKPET